MISDDDMSPEQSSRSTALHSVLQTALGSLDVDLEEELARYRRQSPGRVQRSRQQAMAYVATLTKQSQATPTEPSAIAQSASDAPVEEQAFLPANMAHAATQDVPAATHAGSAPDGYLESSEELLRSLEELQTPIEPPAEQEPETTRSSKMLASLLTPLGVGSILLLILSSATLGYLVVNPSVMTRLTSPAEGDRPGAMNDDATAGRPDGISPDLASNEFDPLNLNRLSSIPSERNLDSLNGSSEGTTSDAGNETESEGEEMPTVSVPQAPANQPSVVTPAPAQSSSPGATSTPRATPSRNAAPQTAALPRVAPRPAPQARPAPRSNPAPSNSQPSPSRAAAPSAPAPSAPAPSSSGSSSSSNSGSSGSTAPSTPSSAAVASTPASSEDYVYVVTPYTGDNSLEEAQQAVSGAYVRNSSGGAQVQMGAFSNPQGAQDLVEELNNQGIPAQIQD